MELFGANKKITERTYYWLMRYQVPFKANKRNKEKTYCLMRYISI